MMVQGCFRTPAADFGPKFNDYHTRSLAFDVLELCGWTDFSSFKQDMLSLQ